MKDKTWARICKTEGCRILTYPTSDYCKSCRDERKKVFSKHKTMNDVYDDGSDHIICKKCGFCIKCGDCAEFGCKEDKDAL